MKREMRRRPAYLLYTDHTWGQLIGAAAEAWNNLVNGKRVTTARAKPVLRIVSLLLMAFVSFKGPATGTAEQHQ